MWIVWMASALIWMTFTGTSPSPEGCTRGVKDAYKAYFQIRGNVGERETSER
jgi:hypothetical protein